MTKKASTILMIRPVQFGHNEQTAQTNSFQNQTNIKPEELIQTNALDEFNTLVEKLKQNGINVVVFDDSKSPHTPDSIFPNNWISFHESNSIVLYPMLAINRRHERRMDIIDHFKNGKINLIDITNYENKNTFLEGTGSIVFDYENKIGYAAISPRTNKTLFENICAQLNYKAISFNAVDINNNAIYHTNVLMCIGNTFAVLCNSCIKNKNELNIIINCLEETNHEIIEITSNQMNAFAGNMYQLFNNDLESFILMSEQAYKALTKEQIVIFEKHGKIIHSPLYTIEQRGGGSARCMIADVRL